MTSFSKYSGGQGVKPSKFNWHFPAGVKEKRLDNERYFSQESVPMKDSLVK